MNEPSTTHRLVDELLLAIDAPPGEGPLELSSLAVVQLVDLIEASLGVIVSSHDITRENFATRASLRALLERWS